LAACGGSDDTSSTDNGNSADQGGKTATADPTQGGQQGGAAIKTSDIPVGAGKVYKDQHVVVTQPEAGQYKAFTSICPHQRCDVGSVANNVITCPCHMSRFSAADGSVKNGPAPTGLTAKTATVSGDTITVA
jgi:nitrite reductase/ring-hydroxylating ferredoxin subunit